MLVGPPTYFTDPDICRLKRQKISDHNGKQDSHHPPTDEVENNPVASNTQARPSVLQEDFCRNIAYGALPHCRSCYHAGSPEGCRFIGVRYFEDVDGITWCRFSPGEPPAPEEHILGQWTPQRTALDEQEIQVSGVPHI